MNNPTNYERHPLNALFGLPDDMVRALNPRAAQPREHVSSRVWSPFVDVYEDSHAIVIKADLPGLSQEEIDIELTDDTLTIRGERKFVDEPNREKYIRVERQYGSFQRSFTIGIPIEHHQVRATYKNGVLELTLPKSEAVKPKKVQVSVE